MIIARAGIPIVINGTALQTPASVNAAKWVSNTPTSWIRFRNKSANSIKVYFTEADFSADANAIVVPTTEILEGPFELFGDRGLYLKGVGGDSAFELLYAQRI